MTKSLRLPEGLPTCPDCGESVMFTACGVKENTSPESIAALRDLVIAAHRRIAGCHPAVGGEGDHAE